MQLMIDFPRSWLYAGITSAEPLQVSNYSSALQCLGIDTLLDAILLFVYCPPLRVLFCFCKVTDLALLYIFEEIMVSSNELNEIYLKVFLAISNLMNWFFPLIYLLSN